VIRNIDDILLPVLLHGWMLVDARVKPEKVTVAMGIRIH